MYYFAMLPKLFHFIYSDKPEFWIQQGLNVMCKSRNKLGLYRNHTIQTAQQACIILEA